MNNYPPGVTGNELEIAGPDYEKESDIPCPYIEKGEGEDRLPCGEPTMEQGYQHDRWLVCDNDHTTDLESPEPDPDRAYDEERDRQMVSGSTWGHEGEELEGEPR